jgi:hypothetical protein
MFRSPPAFTIDTQVANPGMAKNKYQFFAEMRQPARVGGLTNSLCSVENSAYTQPPRRRADMIAVLKHVRTAASQERTANV